MILDRDKYDKNKLIMDAGDCIIAKGGDGTILKAIYRYANLGKPFFGVAAGTVNFLMNEEDYIDANHKVKQFDRIKVEVTYEVEPPMGVSTFYKNHRFVPVKTETFMAFNDVCIGGDMNSWIDFDIKEKDGLFGEVKGGGLIISTPQGSTGINKSNRGSVLPLTASLWSITGDKTTSEISYVIKPRKIDIVPTSRTPVTVWIDGANKIIENVTNVRISKGDKVEVIFNKWAEFIKKRRL